MNIIEQSLIAKSPKKASEDGIVITDDFIAVIDGSTSKTKRRHNRQMSNGRYAMKLISSYIRRMPKETTCHQFCLGATRVIRERYTSLWSRLREGSSEQILQRLFDHPEERLCASVIIFSRLRREVWLVGDCHCLLNGEYCDNPKPYEQELAEMRAQRVRELLAEGVKPSDLLQQSDPAREVMIPHMLEVMHNQNVTYAVVDGFPIPESKVPVIALGFEPFEIVLASDGYPFLCPTLEASEQRLQQQRDTDPLNIGSFKATKAFVKGNNSFDDRSYIRFTV
ncbi:MAG: hypothetical protein IJV20_02445 [Prevotella sp.]|nr:hypothetical protein [Prevotella sp.]